MGTPYTISLLFVVGLMQPVASSQTGQQKGPRKPAVNVIVEFPDDAGRAFDLASDEFSRVAGDAVVAEGWDLDPSSKYFVRVSIDPVTQREEDLYAFRIKVEGGPLAPRARTRAAYNLTSVHVVDVPLRDHEKLLAETDEMVRTIAYKLLHRIQPQRPNK